MLPEKALDNLRLRFYRFFFNRWWFVAVIVGLGTTFCCNVAPYGAFRLEVADPAVAGGRVFLSRPGESHGAARRLPASGAFNLPVLAGDWVVKVEGYPALFASVHSFERQEISVPDHFLRRVVLLLPGLDELTNWERRVVELTVLYNDEPWVIPDYSGFALWLGCGEDVAIPDSISNELRRLLESSTDRLRHTSKWMRPRSLFRAAQGPRSDRPDEFPLSKGDVVEVRVRNRRGPVPLENPRYVVETMSRPADHVHPIWILPKEENTEEP